MVNRANLGVPLEIGTLADGDVLSVSGSDIEGVPLTTILPPVKMSQKAPTVAVVITAGYSAYVADEYECKAGVETEIGLGATFEIG